MAFPIVSQIAANIEFMELEQDMPQPPPPSPSLENSEALGLINERLIGSVVLDQRNEKRFPISLEEHIYTSIRSLSSHDMSKASQLYQVSS